MSDGMVPDKAHEAALSRWMDDYGDLPVRLAYGVLKDSYLAQDRRQRLIRI